MINIDTCIFSYAITKGMKSYGPKGILTQKTNTSKTLITCQLETISSISSKVYIITGFGREKLYKNMRKKNSVIDIYNQNYEKHNDGHAIKLLLNTSDSDHLLVLSDGVILRLGAQDIKNKESTIFCTKLHNNWSLGCVFDKNTSMLEHIFYDVGHLSWCEAVLFGPKEIDIMKRYILGHNVDNMFLFEIINETIKCGAKYKITKIASKYCKKIQSVKDANKVRTINI